MADPLFSFSTIRDALGGLLIWDQRINVWEKPW